MRIGLTGGIGCGKSVVAGMLTSRGATLIDTDAISRRLTAVGGAAMPALKAAFGESLVGADGALDRAAMRALAFSDATARHRLESLLHPRIGAEALREAAAATGPVVVFDIPLLTESRHWRERVDRVLVIDCSAATQIERILLRPGWSRDVAERVIAGQASRPLRRGVADAVVFNDGISLAALDAAVGAIWKCWRALARGPVEQ